MPEFATLLMAVAVGMLAWDCLEVGKNDAANLINGVFGARVMSHRSAVWLAAGSGRVIRKCMASCPVRSGRHADGAASALPRAPRAPASADRTARSPTTWRCTTCRP